MLLGNQDLASYPTSWASRPTTEDGNAVYRAKGHPLKEGESLPREVGEVCSIPGQGGTRDAERHNGLGNHSEARGAGAPASSLSERSGLSVPAVVIQWWYE